MTLTVKKLKPSKDAKKYMINIARLKGVISNKEDGNMMPRDIFDPEFSNKSETIEAIAFPKSVLDELYKQCGEDHFLVVIPVKDDCIQDETGEYRTETAFRSVALSIWAHSWRANAEKPDNLVPDCLEGVPIFMGGTPIPPPPPPNL